MPIVNLTPLAAGRLSAIFVSIADGEIFVEARWCIAIGQDERGAIVGILDNGRALVPADRMAHFVQYTSAANPKRDIEAVVARVAAERRRDVGEVVGALRGAIAALNDAPDLGPDV